MNPLTAYRPTEEQLDAEWSPAERAQLRARIEATSADVPAAAPVLPHRRRRRWTVAAVVVGTAAATVLALQVALPSGTPGGSTAAGAATLEKLATTAQSSPALGPNQYWHLLASYSDGRKLESWTSATGEIWRHDTEPSVPDSYYRFPAGGSSVNYPSPSFLAGLPTDPGALTTYLRSHVTGSTSKDEAVFVAVGDMLRLGYAPAGLRAAAIRVLEHTPHVSAASATDSLGRAAVRISFTDNLNRPGQAQELYFDPSTSVVLEEHEGGLIESYTEASVVEAVPADVLAQAADQSKRTK